MFRKVHVSTSLKRGRLHLHYSLLDRIFELFIQVAFGGLVPFYVNLAVWQTRTSWTSGFQFYLLAGLALAGSLLFVWFYSRLFQKTHALEQLNGNGPSEDRSKAVTVLKEMGLRVVREKNYLIGELPFNFWSWRWGGQFTVLFTPTGPMINFLTFHQEEGPSPFHYWADKFLMNKFKMLWEGNLSPDC